MIFNLIVTSPAFADNDFIPVRYTRQGENISPPLMISNITGIAKSIAIIMDDPDAPKGVFTHWLIWNIPASFSMIPEGIPNEAVVYSLGGALQGRNDSGDLGYDGPMPPKGQVHTYRINIFILDTYLSAQAGSGRLILEYEMNNHIIQYGLLRGRYMQINNVAL